MPQPQDTTPAPTAEADIKTHEKGSEPSKDQPKRSLRDTLKAAQAHTEVKERQIDEAARILKNGTGSEPPKGEESPKPVASTTKEAPKDPPKEDPKPTSEAKPKPDDKAAPKEDPKPKPGDKPAASGNERDAQGRFQSQAKPDDQPGAEPKPASASTPAPTRFSKEAQADWDNTPETVRNETQRAMKEMQDGIQKYRGAAEYLGRLKPYNDMAKSIGMDIEGVLKDYSEMATKIGEDPIGVFTALAKRHGHSLHELAAEILDGDLHESMTPIVEENKTLLKENQELKAKMAKVEKYFADRKAEEDAKTLTEVDEFMKSKPRWDELHERVMWVIKTGGATGSTRLERLQDAYAIAERLIPATGDTPPGKTATKAADDAAHLDPDPAAQTRKAAKSISGAPSSGSDPEKRTPAKSVRDAVRSAARRSGIA